MNGNDGERSSDDLIAGAKERLTGSDDWLTEYESRAYSPTNDEPETADPGDSEVDASYGLPQDSHPYSFSRETERPPPVPRPVAGSPPPVDRFRFGSIVGRIPIGLVVFALLFIGPAVWSYFTDAKRDDSGAITDAGDLGFDQMRVGDCVNVPEGVSETAEIESLNAVPCSEAHDQEIVGFVALPVGPYPGRDGLERQAEPECGGQFEEFTGLRFEHEAHLALVWYYPTADSWADGDRTITCGIEEFKSPLGGPRAQLVGSQRDAGRLGVNGMQIGSCYVMHSEPTYEYFDLVDCDVDHDIEPFAEVTMVQGESDPFPGEESVDEYAERICAGRYAAHTGQPWSPSATTDYVWVRPHAETWDLMDRAVRCFLVPAPDTSVSG